MDEILKLPECQSAESVRQLRYIFDQLNIHVRGLKALGVDSYQYGSLLIPIIMSKLPSEIRLIITRKTKKPVWELDEILDLLQFEVEAREISVKVKTNESVGNVIKEEKGPVAVESELGWILSGPAESNESKGGCNNTVTNLIIDMSTDVPCKDDLTEQLKTFWQTETIGIYDILDDNPDVIEHEEFLGKIRHDGTRSFDVISSHKRKERKEGMRKERKEGKASKDRDEPGLINTKSHGKRTRQRKSAQVKKALFVNLVEDDIYVRNTEEIIVLSSGEENEQDDDPGLSTVYCLREDDYALDELVDIVDEQAKPHEDAK
ncbi:hypothetical protein QZH41_004258 [Actinostola sp. cb2023]|nr:hypothetical protein QZH41_004258 [Actinostola sp. cb2023]